MNVKALVCLVGAFSVIVKLQALRRFVYRSTRYLDALRSVEKVEKCKIKHKIKIKQIFHIPNIAVSAPLAQQPEVMVVAACKACKGRRDM